MTRDKQPKCIPPPDRTLVVTDEGIAREIIDSLSKPRPEQAMALSESSRRIQPVRIFGEVECSTEEGYKLAQFHAFENILGHLEISTSTSIRIDDYDVGEYLSGILMGCYGSWAIRGLLRSKTKRGPKRKWRK